MIDYTRDDYHLARHPEFVNDEELCQAWSFFADLAYFRSVKRGQAVLEFGGGLGTNLLEVAKRAKTQMVEASTLGREIAIQAGIGAVAGVEELGEQKFDCILCRHVLEHLENPAAVLRDLRFRMTPRARLIVAVPCEKPDEAPRPNDLNHHLYCWNPQTLANLLGVCGFRIEVWRYEYYGAKRRLMPVYRTMGGEAYARLVRFVGRVCRFRELVIEASPDSLGGTDD
jgi:SAM-dependent methyltransferase